MRDGTVVNAWIYPTPLLMHQGSVYWRFRQGHRQGHVRPIEMVLGASVCTLKSIFLSKKLCETEFAQPLVEKRDMLDNGTAEFSRNASMAETVSDFQFVATLLVNTLRIKASPPLV